MDDAERQEFCDEMGVEAIQPGELVRQIMDVSGQMLFFTAGDKEVRTWMIHQGPSPEDRLTREPSYWPGPPGLRSGK